MTTLAMTTSRGTVPYHVSPGALDHVGELVGEVCGGRAFVVSDSTVAPLHAAAVADRLAAPLLALAAGEEHKNLAAAERVARWLLASGAERRDVVVAVGGGVVTDVAGFAASITLRGVAWVAVPTTLLGMVDAAIGGKTGVDLDVGKNLIGTFWQPAAVIADPLALATLDRRQVRSGLAEVVKAAIIAPGPLSALVDLHAARLAGGDAASVAELILEAARVKAEIVAADEREGGRRAALNLGHTLGHALEAATGYRRFLHGEAVAWGMLTVLVAAVRGGFLPATEARAWAARISTLAPLPPIDDLRWEDVAAFISRDKKASGGRVGWVMPRPGGVDVGVPLPLGEAAAAFRASAAVPPSGPFDRLF